MRRRALIAEAQQELTTATMELGFQPPFPTPVRAVQRLGQQPERLL